MVVFHGVASIFPLSVAVCQMHLPRGKSLRFFSGWPDSVLRCGGTRPSGFRQGGRARGSFSAFLVLPAIIGRPWVASLKADVAVRKISYLAAALSSTLARNVAEVDVTLSDAPFSILAYA